MTDLVPLSTLKPGDRFRWANVLFELDGRDNGDRLGVVYVDGLPPRRFDDKTAYAIGKTHSEATPAGTKGLMRRDDEVEPVAKDFSSATGNPTTQDSGEGRAAVAKIGATSQCFITREGWDYSLNHAGVLARARDLSEPHPEMPVPAKEFIIHVEVKDSDAFQELVYALPEGQKWITFGEYASIELTCEVNDGAPVVKAARFVK